MKTTEPEVERFWRVQVTTVLEVEVKATTREAAEARACEVIENELGFNDFEPDHVTACETGGPWSMRVNPVGNVNSWRLWRLQARDLEGAWAEARKTLLWKNFDDYDRETLDVIVHEPWEGIQ